MFCGCGCGKHANEGRMFIHGHNMKWKFHSKLSKKNHSIARTALWQTPEYRKKHSGKNHWAFGKHFSATHKNNLSEAHKGIYPSKDTIMKRSKALMGRTGWSKGLTKETDPRLKKHSKFMTGRFVGEKSPLYGKKRSIKSRTQQSETRTGKYAGENHPNWRGGTCNEPYSFIFNVCLKRHIKERDDYTCQRCGDSQPLVIHHIDYDKKNNHSSNLITLCNSCNVAVNFDRIHWQSYFGSKNEKCTQNIA